MNPHIALETEVKLRVPSIGGLAPRLEKLGFRLETPAQEEHSVLWDRGADLLDQGCALRLRTYAGRAFLTWKGAKVEDPVLKVRPELETLIQSAETMEGILRAIGFTPVLAMTKTREVWRRADLVACLDQTPFGCFLELEGEAGAIRAAMAALALGPELAERRSYPTLYRAHGLA